MDGFYKEVYVLTRCIPRGQVTSYGRIARMLCKPHGARAVGYALRALSTHGDDPIAQDIPWHRVVNHQGVIRVHTPGDTAPLQVELLRDEGVLIVESGGQYQVDMRSALWPGLSLLEVEFVLQSDGHPHTNE